MIEERYYTREQLATLLQKNVRTIDAWRKAGKLSYIKVAGSYLYPVDQEALQTRREESD